MKSKKIAHNKQNGGYVGEVGNFTLKLESLSVRN